MSGHCEHCADKCSGGVVSADETVWHISRDGFVRWHPKAKCPACAERERIADAIAARLKQEEPAPGTMPDEWMPLNKAFRDGLATAARIARGEE